MALIPTRVSVAGPISPSRDFRRSDSVLGDRKGGFWTVLAFEIQSCFGQQFVLRSSDKF